MPTGYTYKLMENGQTFREFVLACARAFGACITMRDDPPDAPIPEKFEPNPYYTKRVAEAKAELAELKAMTREQELRYGRQRKAAQLKSLSDYIAKVRAENDRLNSMLKQVKAWKAPAELNELKNFMIQQIEVSLNNENWDSEGKRLQALSEEAVFNQAFESAKRAVASAEESLAREVKNCAERTAWLKTLRDSLPGK